MSARITSAIVVTAVALALPATSPVVRAGQGEKKVVRLRTLRPGDTLYVLLGGGGNSLAVTGEELTVLVDSKSVGWGQATLDAINFATDKPVTTIINTHANADFIAGNLEIPTATTIIAHANTKAAMERMEMFKGAGARGLPNKIVTDKMSLLEDGRDRIDLYYFGAGHTNGDLVVVFPVKQVAYFGDLFPSKAAPLIDAANGGSAVAFPETLAKAVAGITGVTRVITGREEGLRAVRNSNVLSTDSSTPVTMTWADLQEYADFNRDFVAAVKAAMTAGKSAADAAATLKLPDRYKAYDMQRAKANVEILYKELAAR